MRLRLATRGSSLAWTQSGLVADALRARGHEVELVRITTHGDLSDAPLASLGGSGVFVGAVRAAVIAGDADLAVHSFKDLPTGTAVGLVLGAVPEREDVADALCARDGLTLAGLPLHARVGTGSPRRAAQVLALRPDLEVVAIRGNVETRLRRAGDDLDAVVLAAAGINRLGLSGAVTQRFDPAEFLPAPAQGALAVECRSDATAELRAALALLDHAPTRLAALAERAVLAGLEAGCAAPVAAYATVTGDRLVLNATVVALDGSARVCERGETAATEVDAVSLGGQVARALLSSGAGSLADLGARTPHPLAGRSLLLPERAPAGTGESLAAAGADVVRASFTGTVPLSTQELEAVMDDGWDWVVVTSAQTLAVLQAAAFDLAGRLPAGTRFAAVGPATAHALADGGIVADLVADPGGGSNLVAAFPAGPGRILLPGAEQPSAEPAAGLAAKGWDVRHVAVYRTEPAVLAPEVVSGWTSGRFDALVVTAGSVARAAVEGCGLPGPRAVAIGAAAAEAAQSLGLEVAAVAARPDAAGLLDAVVAALTTQPGAAVPE